MTKSSRPVWWFPMWLAAAGLMTQLGSAATPVSRMEVRDAWIRWLPADVPGGAYFTLVNDGASDRVLVAVTSPDYGEVSMHQTVEDHGISSMRAVESVTLKPKIPFRFTAGGYHLMLMQPRRAVHPGDIVMMTLRFKEGPPLEVSFKVRASD